jgi:hypothetical protein
MQKPVNSETNLIKAIWNRTILNEATVTNEPDLFSGIVPPAGAEKRAFSPKPKAATQYDQFGIKLTKTGNRAVKQTVKYDPTVPAPSTSAEPYPTIQTAAKPLRTAGEIASAKDTSGIKVTTGSQAASAPVSTPADRLLTPQDFQGQKVVGTRNPAQMQFNQTSSQITDRLLGKTPTNTFSPVGNAARTTVDPVKNAIDQTAKDWQAHVAKQGTRTVDGIGGFPNDAAADAKFASGGEGKKINIPGGGNRVEKPEAKNVYPVSIGAKAGETPKPGTPGFRGASMYRPENGASTGTRAVKSGANLAKNIGIGIGGLGANIVGELAAEEILKGVGMKGGKGSDERGKEGAVDFARHSASNLAGGAAGGAAAAALAGGSVAAGIGTGVAGMGAFAGWNAGRALGHQLGTDDGQDLVKVDTSKLGLNPGSWIDATSSPMLTVKGQGIFGGDANDGEVNKAPDMTGAQSEDPRNFAALVRSGKMTQADADKKTKEIYGADDAKNAAAAAATAPKTKVTAPAVVAPAVVKPASAAPAQAAPSGKQYNYPDTFVGREMGTEEAPSAAPAPVKKQTVDQQLASTAKQITDKSGAQKAAAASASVAPAAKPTRSVTPVQITEPGKPAGQLNQPQVQRPATSQEDLKRVRWNSASYHQLSPDEKKFVEDNDAAQGFSKMAGGKEYTEKQMGESFTSEKQQIVEHYRQVLAQKLMEQEYWGMDKVTRAIQSGLINPESYRTDRKGMEHIHSALEGGTITPFEGQDKGGGQEADVPLDQRNRRSKEQGTQMIMPVGQQIFPDNPAAQASLQVIMSSMGKIHGSQKSVGGEKFHPALAGTVPHDPSTHGALNQLDPSTVAHTQALRKAQQTRTDTSRDSSY